MYADVPLGNYCQISLFLI